MSNLFSPITLKGLKLKNKIVMAPMCQYSVEAKNGSPNDWHYVHYVSRAVGGTGLIIVEMTDVDPDGRITDFDLGLWADEQIPAYERIVNEVHKYDAKIGIQIAHAGRKATDAKQPVGSSNIPVDVEWKIPRALTTLEVQEMVGKYKEAAKRAVIAGFDTIELHGAHGYLIHQFHSPAINNRTDEYGKDLSKFGVEVIQAVRSVMPEEMPLLFRISAVEYMDNGYGLEHSLEIAKKYKEAGVDVFHVSSGGEATPGKIKPANTPGYQVPFARAYKEALNVPVIAVGILEDPNLAEKVIQEGDAELVAIGRGMLKDPYWALHAEEVITGKTVPPTPYKRGF
ncbi:NADH:flavin oxidoreductase/NADH oxidase [Psychrobacillus sp. NPDC058041]|uniref:NADH:flavin oxidoreductase/NADH oxidase n=1 Tax=Psychrobacillus sp. NPDC058041 TaxID=3346310 RepID=UPI0036D9C7C3